jgi:hypothetical protein
MLSSEHSIRRHTKQWKWLVSHLRNIDRCVTPWVVVGFHRPLYAVHPHRANRVVRGPLQPAPILAVSRRILNSQITAIN